jgi:uncharacterized protein YkvS
MQILIFLDKIVYRVVLMVFVEVLIWFCRGLTGLVNFEKVINNFVWVDYLLVGEGVIWGKKWGF